MDGRKVKMLDVAFSVRCRDVRHGQDAKQLPALVILFYDENRAFAGQGIVGPWNGSFDWRQESTRIEVPPRAREDCFIGLLSAVGEISFDRIEVKAATNK